MKMVKLSRVLQNLNVLRCTVDDDAPAFGRLVVSIARRGLHSPLTVRAIPKRWWFSRQKYSLIDGLHRLEACKLLKMKHVPIQIVTLSEEGVLSTRIMASKRHVPISKKQYAEALAKILAVNPKLTIEELAKRISKPVEWVREKLK